MINQSELELIAETYNKELEFVQNEYYMARYSLKNNPSLARDSNYESLTVDLLHHLYRQGAVVEGNPVLPLPEGLIHPWSNKK